MTDQATPTLKPCPFCGGAAQRIEISDDDGFGNQGGSVISCQTCHASSHVEFGRKENLESRWNTRAAQHAEQYRPDAIEVTQADLIERLRATPYSATDPEGSLFLEASNALATQAAEIARLREALEPFAAMGRVMETRARVTFGKMPKDSEIVCESSGEAGMGILTMGHFRDASATLPDAPGWGGAYKPLPIRAALSAHPSEQEQQP